MRNTPTYGMALARHSIMTKADVSEIESKIFLIRGEKVLLGPDLAELYEVPTKRLSEQVRRNLRRFPSDFMFTLSDQEFRNLKSHFATSSSNWGGSRKPPLAFTEQGVAMNWVSFGKWILPSKRPRRSPCDEFKA